MRYLLARENAEVLAQFASSRALLAFDFDGTLAPIVSQREKARMRPSTGNLFAKLCKLYPCAVISGRSRRDVAERFSKIPVKYVIGNHGLEPGKQSKKLEREIARAHRDLDEALVGWGGIDIEDKCYSLSVHYRKSRRKTLARKAIYEAVAALPVPLRVVPGKLVINVIPKEAPNKGDALLELRTAEHADTALFVGDDVTDEDVFEIDQPGRLLSVRVGESKTSSAAYYLRNQQDIDRLLARLVELRKKFGSP
jgi:trehalose 6-phosphate phosphatase